MQEMLCTGSVTNIAALVGACQFSKNAYVLLERFPTHIVTDSDRADLLRFRFLGENTDDDAHNLNKSTSGRVFQADRELRWEKDGDVYKAVYLGAEHDFTGLNRDKGDDRLLKNLKRQEQPKRYYLFGELLDTTRLTSMGLEGDGEKEAFSYYAEVRIPRLLRYPAPPKARRVQLVVCEYTDEATGSVQLFRFQDLVPEE